MHNQELHLQIFQGAGFQRGGVHAPRFTATASAGFHAGGVYATSRPLAPPILAPEPVVLQPTRKRRSV